MRDRVQGNLQRILANFGGFTPGQKAVTLVAVVVIGVGGYFFANWASTPAYAPLFSNLAAGDASAIVDKLSAEATPYELTNGGQTIMVPADQVYDLRLKMSGQGLPAAQDSGYALLDKQGITTSEFMQQVGYQRALEGELSKTIKAIDGVNAATVHLAIPQKDVFADDQKKPTASVLVATGPGKNLSSNQVQAIIHLVASSVEGLEPKQVTLAGADGVMMSSGGEEGTVAAAGDARSQQIQQFEQRMGGSLQRMLDQVVGAGHAVVQVSADLDFDQTDTKTQTYVSDPKLPALAETQNTETYNGAGAPTGGGVLGPDNIAAPGTNANGKYEKKNTTRNNAVGTVTETRRSAPGKVRRLGVAVLLDSNTAKGVDNDAIEELVASAVSLDPKRGDTVAITGMAFDQSAAKQAKKAMEDADEAASQSELMSMIETGGIALAIVVLLVLAFLASRRTRKAQLTAEELEQIKEAQLALDHARTRELEPAPVSTVPAIETGAPPDTGLEERMARQKDIAELVERQPQEVAQLLRSWLADQRSS